MPEAVIVDAIRTPIGRAVKGLNGLDATDGTLGLETMCVAGGMGQAMIVERLN